MNENEKGFGQEKQGQQGDWSAQDKNQQFGQGQQGQELGQDKGQQFDQDQQPEMGQGQQGQQSGQDQGQQGGEGSAFFNEGKTGELGQQGEKGQQGQSAWPEKGQRENEETGAGSGESTDKSGGRY